MPRILACANRGWSARPFFLQQGLHRAGARGEKPSASIGSIATLGSAKYRLSPVSRWFALQRLAQDHPEGMQVGTLWPAAIMNLSPKGAWAPVVVAQAAAVRGRLGAAQH